MVFIMAAQTLRCPWVTRQDLRPLLRPLSESGRFIFQTDAVIAENKMIRSAVKLIDVHVISLFSDGIA